jgi:CxxC motif-containing protein (DUF1111 family)
LNRTKHAPATHRRTILWVGAVFALLTATMGWLNGRPAPAPAPRLPAEHLSGGATTIMNATPNAFGQPAPMLARADNLHFFVGNSFFNQNWVQAPSSTTARDGLGPLFNSRSCAGCHFKDGRGRAPAPGETAVTGFLLRLSQPPSDGATGEPAAVPFYGGQFQDNAIPGVAPEGSVVIAYTEVPGQFADGEPFSLRAPVYSLAGPGYGELPADLLMSPRVANQMIGLGLLEAVPEAALLAQVDPEDHDGDGISGRPNYVWDIAGQQTALGRFGWKANQPSLLQQVAAAFHGDMGITTWLFPAQNCTSGQTECAAAPSGGEPEIDDDDLAKVVLYASTLAVPGQRHWEDPQVLRGKALFAEGACAGCHLPTLVTGEHPRFPQLSGQTIHPYTDLLLHDMGPGLADNRPDFQATGAEWRTPPLWGIGLFATVNSHTNYLHDGRARSLAEAILWHGGEAEPAKQFLLALPKADRDALIAFLESL